MSVRHSLLVLADPICERVLKYGRAANQMTGWDECAQGKHDCSSLRCQLDYQDYPDLIGNVERGNPREVHF